jgi:hypothetical protein
MKHAILNWVLPLGLLLVVGCSDVQGEADRSETAKARSFFGLGAREHLVAGTALRVRLLESLSSETAKSGDSWHGVIQAPVVVDGDEIIAKGSAAEGVVTTAVPARRGTRAMLEIEVREVTLDGRGSSLRATTDPVIAGSPRARNLGAITGGAVAGALIGSAVSGSGRGAGVGALVGGGVATGVVAASHGYQVVLPEGTVMTFTVSREVAMR